MFETVDNYGLNNETEFNDLSKNQKRNLVEIIKQKCKLNVVGAVYGDTKGMMYSFSRKEEWIKFNPCVYMYLSENNSILQEKNCIAWAEFLSKLNNNHKYVDKNCLQELHDLCNPIIQNNQTYTKVWATPDYL